MLEFIVYFPEKNMYLRSSKLLVHERNSAKKYAAVSTAKRAARNSSWGKEKFAVIKPDEAVPEYL